MAVRWSLICSIVTAPKLHVYVTARGYPAPRLLVKGDPAGGKTTFAKQLLTWIMCLGSRFFNQL